MAKRHWDYTVGARALLRFKETGLTDFQSRLAAGFRANPAERQLLREPRSDNRDYTAVSGQTQCFTFDFLELLFSFEERIDDASEGGSFNRDYLLASGQTQQIIYYYFELLFSIEEPD